MFHEKRVTGVLLAGGSGSRFGGPLNKVYQKLGGIPVLAYSLNVMIKSHIIDEIVVVCRAGDEAELAGIPDVGYAEVRIVHGGSTRQESVYNALQSGCGQIVVIHDGARPFITEDFIKRCVETLSMDDAAMPHVVGSSVAVRAKDTIKLTDEKGMVQETIPRERAWQIQTPQCFITDVLMKAHEDFRNVPGITDDCMLIEKAGGRVRLVEGDYRNIKLTTPEDMLLAESFMPQDC